MNRQLTPEVEDLWRALIGLPEGAAYPRMQKLWLQKFSMDYGAEAVCAALMTCGKMGWYSLDSVERVLKGELSENTRQEKTNALKSIPKGRQPSEQYQRGTWTPGDEAESFIKKRSQELRRLAHPDKPE